MKRFFVLLMAVVMLVSTMAILSSCDHEHEFKEEWAMDANYHWHMCKGDNCLEVSDKAAHDWKEADGKIACAVCGASADAALPDEQVWQAAIAEQKFENVTINYAVEMISMKQNFNGVLTEEQVAGVHQDHIIKVTADKIYRKMTGNMPGSDTPSVHDNTFTGEQAVMQRKLFFETFFALLSEKDNFVYDAEEGVYIAPASVSVTIEQGEGSSVQETMTNGKLKIDANGNIEWFYCTLNEKMLSDGEIYTDGVANITWNFSNYGTTVIE